MFTRIPSVKAAIILAQVLLFAFCLPPAVLDAQAPLDRPAGPHKPVFAVASVRENKSTSVATSNVPLDRGTAYSQTGGVFRATNQPVISYLIFSYKIKVSETLGGLMRSLPKWAITDKFDIDARADDPTTSNEDLRLMVQSLLEERFGLVAHRDFREGPVFGLTPVRYRHTGPQLIKHESAYPCNAAVKENVAKIPLQQLVGSWPPACGDGQEFRSSKERLRTGGRDMSMTDIASWLTGVGDLDRPILDASGLTGNYDFVLEFTPDLPEGVPSPEGTPVSSGPSFFQAMEDQLGLRLTKQRGRSSIFVVDKIGYPTAN